MAADGTRQTTTSAALTFKHVSQRIPGAGEIINANAAVSPG
jgi:hypothetical protein